MSPPTRLVLILPDAPGLRWAPERAVLALLDIHLAVVELALFAEHPTLDELFAEPRTRFEPTLLAAFRLVRRCRELRELLVVYETAIRDALGEQINAADLPF